MVITPLIMLAPFSEPVGWLSYHQLYSVLEPTLSWNQLHSEPPKAKEHNGQMRGRPSALVFSSICAVVDFVFGYIKWHSVLAVLAGVGAMVGGLPLTALLFLLFRASWSVTDDSGMPLN
jgi:hypothetical protein